MEARYWPVRTPRVSMGRAVATNLCGGTRSRRDGAAGDRGEGGGWCAGKAEEPTHGRADRNGGFTAIGPTARFEDAVDTGREIQQNLIERVVKKEGGV